MLLHGQPGDAAHWHGVVDALVEKCRVVVPDRPGYGESDGPARGIADNALVAIDVLDEYEIPSATFVGHSWASAVALAAAASRPERVKALVLVCPVMPGTRPGAMDHALGLPIAGPLMVLGAFRLAGLALSTRRVQRLARRLMPGIDPDQLPSTARSWLTGPVWRSFVDEQRALLAELPTLGRLLGEIDLPTTIVFGEADRITSAEQSRRLARQLAAARLVGVPRGGHLLPLQSPLIVSRVIIEAMTLGGT